MIPTLFFPLSEQGNTVVFPLALPPNCRLISHSQSQVDQSSKVLLSLPSWKDILKNPFLALIPPWHRLGFPKCHAGEGGVSVRAGIAAPGCAEHHGHTRSRKWPSQGRLVPFRVPNSHPCWEMMLLQLFSIPKCKVNADGPRMMGVSLSFSWGDVTLQLFSFVSFFCCGGVRSQKSLHKQTQVSPSSFTTGNSTHRHYCSGDKEHEQGFGERGKTRAVGASSASIGQIQHL